MAERNLVTPYRRYSDNEFVRGRDFNRLAQDVVAQSADAGTAVEPEQVAALAASEKRFVRITAKAQSAPTEPWSYDGSEVIQADDGTIIDRPLPTQFKTGTGATAFYPLRELSGNPTVPIDGSVIVEAVPSDSGAYMTFDYAAVDHWWEITSGAGPIYAGKKKLPQTSGTFADLFNPYTGAVYTTTTLREIHGVTGLAPGTIVIAKPGGSSGAPQVVIGRQQMGDGLTIHEIQTVYIRRATGGSYVIDGDTLAYNHNAAALQAAISGTTVTGSGTEGTPWLVEWADFAAHDLLETDTALLLGGQEWLCAEMYGGDVTFNTLTTNNLIVNLTAVFNSVTVTINNGTWNFIGVVVNFDIDTVINIEGDVYFGDDVVIHGDPEWDNPTGASLVTQVCITTVTGQGTGTTTAATGDWVDIVGSETSVTTTAECKALLVATFDFEWIPEQGDSDTVTVLAVDAAGAPLASYECRAVVGATNYGGPVFQASTAVRFPGCWGWIIDFPEGMTNVKAQMRRASGDGAAGFRVHWEFMSEAVSTVERADFTFPNGTGWANLRCQTNPDDCCSGEITDPGDRVLLPPVVTECCEGLEIPGRLYATPSDQTGDCACIDDVVQLDYNPETGKWEGTGLGCDVSFTLKFYCLANPSWALDMAGPDGQTGHSTVPVTCDPFVWTDTLNLTVLGEGVCAGNVTWTISEDEP